MITIETNRRTRSVSPLLAPSEGPTLPARQKIDPRSSILYSLSLVAVYLLFLHRLADRDLWSSHEARAAMDAQTILDDGNWGMTRLYDGRFELQKPPLYYWLTASLGWLRGGVDAWAVRLPSALSAILCVVAVAVGLGVAKPRSVAGPIATVVLATAVHFTWLARIGRVDMPLTLCITVALGGMYLSQGVARWQRCLSLTTSYLALAAALLLKGPIGVALPTAVMGLHLAVELGVPRPSRWRVWLASLRKLGVWWGVPLVAVLTIPWFVWANRVTDGAFFRVFFWHHNIERGLGGSSLRSNPWWFYGPQFVGDFLPWSLAIPLALWWSRRRGLWHSDPKARFGLVWFGAIFVVLSCSRFKRADYLLPAYPGMAVFLGCAGSDWVRRLSCEGRRRAISAFVWSICITVGIWLFRVEWQLPASEPYRDYRAFAARVRQFAPQPDEVVFFRTEAHPLAFRVGRPLAIVVEWEDLDARLRRPGAHYFVTPSNVVEECRQRLRHLRFERVADNESLSGGKHERPLALLRSVGESGVAAADTLSP